MFAIRPSLLQLLEEEDITMDLKNFHLDNGQNYVIQSAIPPAIGRNEVIIGIDEAGKKLDWIQPLYLLIWVFGGAFGRSIDRLID